MLHFVIPVIDIDNVQKKLCFPARNTRSRQLLLDALKLTVEAYTAVAKFELSIAVLFDQSPTQDDLYVSDEYMESELHEMLCSNKRVFGVCVSSAKPIGIVQVDVRTFSSTSALSELLEESKKTAISHLDEEKENKLRQLLQLSNNINLQNLFVSHIQKPRYDSSIAAAASALLTIDTIDQKPSSIARKKEGLKVATRKESRYACNLPLLIGVVMNALEKVTNQSDLASNLAKSISEHADKICIDLTNVDNDERNEVRFIDKSQFSTDSSNEILIDLTNIDLDNENNKNNVAGMGEHQDNDLQQQGVDASSRRYK